MIPDLLKQLRDIHYPPAIKIWPLAVAWYVVIAFFLCALVAIFYRRFRQYKRDQLKRMVLKQIEELQEKRGMGKNISEELSKLLKRAALARYPRHEVAGLFGEDWLLFLDKTSTTTDFSKGLGRLLLVYPYQKAQQDLPDPLFHLIQNWVKKNL
jgi:Domain of unknown function (DUF4381)